MNILFKLLPIILTLLSDNIYSMESKEENINTIIKNSSSYIPLTNDEYKLVETFVKQIENALPVCYSFTFDGNEKMPEAQELINSFNIYVNELFKYKNKINNFIETSNDFRNFCLSLSYNSKEIINNAFDTITRRMYKIANLSRKVLIPIVFSRLFSQNKVVLLECNDSSFSTQEDYSLFHNKLLSIKNNISTKENNIIKKINSWKIIDIFKYYKEQYKNLYESLISKIDTVCFVFNVNEYSTYMIKYSGIKNRYNNLKNDLKLSSKKPYNTELLFNSKNPSVTQVIHEFLNILNEFKGLVKFTITKYDEIEEEYYKKCNNNTLNTIEHFNNMANNQK